MQNENRCVIETQMLPKSLNHFRFIGIAVNFLNNRFEKHKSGEKRKSSVSRSVFSVRWTWVSFSCQRFVIPVSCCPTNWKNAHLLVSKVSWRESISALRRHAVSSEIMIAKIKELLTLNEKTLPAIIRDWNRCLEMFVKASLLIFAVLPVAPSVCWVF